MWKTLSEDVPQAIIQISYLSDEIKEDYEHRLVTYSIACSLLVTFGSLLYGMGMWIRRRNLINKG